MSHIFSQSGPCRLLTQNALKGDANIGGKCHVTIDLGFIRIIPVIWTQELLSCFSRLLPNMLFCCQDIMIPPSLFHRFTGYRFGRKHRFHMLRNFQLFDIIKTDPIKINQSMTMSSRLTHPGLKMVHHFFL